MTTTQTTINRTTTNQGTTNQTTPMQTEPASTEHDTFDDRTGHDWTGSGLPHDLYREIHKGIRYAMFHTTMQAGSVDAGDAEQVADLLARCTDLIDILHMHHHHEDEFGRPMLERVAPALSATVEAQHTVVEEGITQIVTLGNRLANASGLARSHVAHQLYLDLTRFTAVYLDHQLYEETVVMPALCSAIPVTELEAIHMALRQSIPLDVLVHTMGIMLPAMNVGERADMLGGMSLAPAEVFGVIRRAAQSILTPAQFAEVAARIGLS